MKHEKGSRKGPDTKKRDCVASGGKNAAGDKRVVDSPCEEVMADQITRMIHKAPAVTKKRKAASTSEGDALLQSEASEASVKRKRKAKAASVKLSASSLPAGNLEEAAAMRSRLGIDAADPASASTKVPFSFAFPVPPSTVDTQLSNATSSDRQSDASESASEASTRLGGDAATAASTKAQVEGTAASDQDRVAMNGHAGTSAANTESEGQWNWAQNGSDAEVKPVRSQRPPELEVDEEGNVPRRVYIGGMPFWYSEAEIRECWSECGAIESLCLLTFPDSGNFRGIAFITFETEAAYAAALAFHGEDLDGKTLVVKPCKAPAGHVRAPRARASAAVPRPAAAPAKRENASQEGLKQRGAKKEPREAPGKVDGYNVLFVGNIPWEMDKAAIEELFSSFTPKFVRMFVDAKLGKHRGFAHVHFGDAVSVEKALEMNGQSLMGRTLKVMYAQPSAGSRVGHAPVSPRIKRAAKGKGAAPEPRKSSITQISAANQAHKRDVPPPSAEADPLEG